MAGQVNDRAIPTEETFHLLREKAKADGDAFTVKVWRRTHMGAVPELAASLSGAMVEHFSNPELWIPNLCGGGNFSLQGYHPTDLGKPVGGFLQFTVKSSEPKSVDSEVIKKPEWRGPPVLDFPQKESPRDRDAGSMYDVRSPPGPGEGSRSATATTQTWPRQPGGDVLSPNYGGEASWQVQRQLQGALEAEKRRLDEERLANEREKHKNELAALAKSHEADMAKMEARIMGAMQKPTGPDPSIAMFETMMKLQASAALAATEDRREREKQAAEDRRAAELRQERNDERFNKLLEKMSDRPKEDPLAMIEKVSNIMGKNNSNDAQLKMMHSMAEMHQMQIGTAMDFIQASADMQLGAREKEESPIIKGIEAAVKGVAAMAKGAQVKRPPQQFAQPVLQPTYEQQARAPQQAPQPPPPQQAQPQQPVPTILEQLENGIRGKADVKVVAKAIVNHIKDPSVLAALFEVGNDFEVLINNRLGTWAKEHVDNDAYLKLLVIEVEKELRAGGYIQPEEDAQVEEEQGADEGEENEE